MAQPTGKKVKKKPKRQSRRIEKVGDERKRHPIPLRLRHRYVPREHGGAEGYRGPGWSTIRKDVLARDRNRSTISGYDEEQGRGLQVDHIHPFRLGGRNRMSNLRVTDQTNNWAIDHMYGARERLPRRDKRW